MLHMHKHVENGAMAYGYAIDKKGYIRKSTRAFELGIGSI